MTQVFEEVSKDLEGLHPDALTLGSQQLVDDPVKGITESLTPSPCSLGYQLFELAVTGCFTKLRSACREKRRGFFLLPRCKPFAVAMKLVSSSKGGFRAALPLNGLPLTRLEESLARTPFIFYRAWVTCSLM